ncbi:MAG: 1-deoxy-D-xylulose-5-phosphate reductoisomerase [Candidatus Latescibacteria bacterium]|nr:1-deoxy-D-xylulose-5-phosphate reductoisomerase [Candidatus Latescibacterota bacterium]NIM22140.1 1-deoxy-D-xylulose-5-phosphate reductoisomerase [Candidatus Latescibacterota bacterium]NIM64690.1 1-deoxy-D-xylulose-5-phosphate reductoisomerase [Candidatus Latescibacterota bacterium]NIO01200.1 1-deoxy-D-xylulose-5-phosphate reductoisomerase [Candidatus Latescibacterota bacterium]NIO27585.1 1-deoxy-D-xylulose-5-phosphate reductoisomerase [Candidatus Latescibacterota bacterium]
MKRIVVLGATGSIGRNVLNVAEHHRNRFKIVGLAAGMNVSLLEEQCRKHADAKFTVCDAEAHDRIMQSDPSFEKRSAGHGDEAIVRLISETQPDLVVNAFVGFKGLKPAFYCLSNGIAVALANKEAVVAGGEILMNVSKSSDAPIIPVDSEHAAISQCLRGYSTWDVKCIYLTASGGALRDRPLEELESAGVEEVLSHPTWKMGDKITVDSATMLNKGLEVIEAKWLFDLPLGKINVVVHPQSIVHSLVEFSDGSILAQMSVPDMRLPILYALSYPERIESDLVPSRIEEFPELSFKPVDINRYPCLKLAREAAEMGGSSPTVLLASNEVAVATFLAGEMPFSQISVIIEDALNKISTSDLSSVEDIFKTAEVTRKYVGEKFHLKNKKSTWSWSC